jgi:hypothetical protein
METQPRPSSLTRVKRVHAILQGNGDVPEPTREAADELALKSVRRCRPMGI